MKLSSEAKAQADEVRSLTVAEAGRLPGLLGRVVPAALRSRGWYGYTETATGRRVLIERAA